MLKLRFLAVRLPQAAGAKARYPTMPNMQAAAPLEYKVGDQPVPGYTLVRELGRGAMGVVWLARTDSGFEAAIKIIDLLKGGGKKEYRGLRTIKHKKIRHGNLLTLFDYWLKDRNGNLIPDSDELDASDSFFGPVSANSPPGQPMSATTPQSMSATEAGPQPASRASSRPTMLPGDMRHAGTLVSSGTVVDPAGLVGAIVHLNATLDSGPMQRPPLRRPVQLIVAMELGDCTLDLRQKNCQEDGKPGLAVDELLPYMEQAARGLDYLHREGIVHRDVKPHNIMLVGDVAKVCDYGLIVTTDADLKATSNAFTPLYASPEAVSDKPVTGQSDQYSLAVTYIELLTGRSPYSSETAASVYAAKETGKYDLSRVRATAVRNVLKRALATSPNDRFGSCSEFIRHLEKAEHVRSGAGRAVITIAATLLVAAGAALAVPGIRQPIMEAFKSDSGGSNGGNGNGGSSGQGPGKNEVEPAPADLRQVVADARKSRLAGNFEEAAAELKKAGDKSHWSLDLERLHLEIASALSAGEPITADQWSQWQRRSDGLWLNRGEDAEHVQLAALRLLLGTRNDSTRISFELPLVNEFAVVGSGQSHWGTVLSADDQKRLQAIFQALNQTFTQSRERFPDTWKESFGNIWPEPEGSSLLIKRVDERILEADEKGLEAAELDLNEVAELLGLNSSPAQAELQETRQAISRAKGDFFIKRVSAQLATDELLTSAPARERLLSELDRRSEAAKHPLAQLARLEAEMANQDAAGRPYLGRFYETARKLIGEMSTDSENTRQAWLDHARFLSARLQLSLKRGELISGQSDADAKVLLEWPRDANGSWQTPKRTEQAAAVMLQLADAALPPSDASVFSLMEIGKERIALALKLVEKAGELKPEWPAVQAVGAALLAIASQPDGDWTRVLERAQRALAASGATSDPLLQARKPLLEYVAAYAASRVKNVPPAERDSALVRYAALLKAQFQDSDEGAPSADEKLYSHLVVPALGLAGGDYSVQGEARAALAALYAAKARLLERDDSYNLVGPRRDEEPLDGFERTILAANQAYAKARELEENVTYAGGYGRTLLKLSRQSFNVQRQQHFEILSAIVQRYDADGSSNDASLRLIQGWVNWQRAVTANTPSGQRERVADSLRHYRAVGDITANRDPYELNSLSLTLGSNAHVQAAFWTPIGPGDLRPSEVAATDKNPLEMTKTEHLLEAVSLARAAELDEGRRNPEEAYISEGNGLEDLAFYCKRVENYEQAFKAFGKATDNAGLRSKTYALLSFGRCEYRSAREPANVDATPAQRQARLRQAYQTLNKAIASAETDDSRDGAEANWWMAQLLAEAANSGPGTLEGQGGGALEQETLRRLREIYAEKDSRQAAVKAQLSLRMKHLERAWQHAEKAAQMASIVAPHESLLYVVESLENGISLASVLGDDKDLYPSLEQKSVLSKLRKDATDFLEKAASRPPGMNPGLALRALLVLADASYVRTLTDDDNLSVTMLKKYENLFSGEDERDELVEVLLRQSVFSGKEEPLIRAEELARRVPAPAERERAIGLCLRARADRGFSLYRRAVSEAAAAHAAGRPVPKVTVDSALTSIFYDAEQALARSFGDDVAENLKKLREQPLANLPVRFERTLTNLEAHRLRSFAWETANLRRKALLAARDWFDLANMLGELGRAKQNQKFPAAATPYAQRMHDWLKTQVILRDEGSFTPNDRELLEVVERKLAIKP